MSDTCVWCASPASNLRCAGCKIMCYCSAECQKQHWNSGHKGQCRALSTNDQEYIKSHTAKADDFKFPTRYLFPPKRVSQMLDFKLNAIVGAGLHNIGNTCFMNSVLQSLLYTPGFYNYIVSGDHSKICNIKGFCMACLMERHAYEVLTQQGGVVYPRDIFLNLKKIGDFQLLTQEDAHEFYGQVLDRLHTSFLKISNEEKTDPLTEGTTLMRQLFGGYFQNQVQCCECKSVSRTYEPFTTLPISVSPSTSSVEQALLQFTAIEHMSEDNGYRCDKCKKAVAADKQLLVRVAPPILVLSLKRFDFMMGGTKIDRPLIFHNELLLDAIYPKENQAENENYKYVLYALVVHFGKSAYSGHYVSFVKIGERWILFDDAKVYEVSPAVVMKQKAYMLFYKRDKMDPSQRQLLNQQFQKSANNNNNKKNANDLNINNLRISGDSSSSSSPVSPSSPVSISGPSALPTLGTPNTPNFKMFFRPSENEEIVDIVLRVHLPLLTSSEKMIVSAGAQGSIKLLVMGLYFLDVSIPFTLNTETSVGYFFQKNAFLFVVFPVAQDVSKVKPTNSVKIISIKKEEEPPVDLHVKSEHEIEVTPNKLVQKKKTNIQEEEERRRQNELAKDESTYVGLYRHVKEWSEKKKSGNVIEERQTQQPRRTENTKVGRNDPCPCGSGRKYKLCHGA